MNKGSIALLSALALLATSLVAAEPLAPKTRREAAAEWSADGLQKADVKGLDVVYLRPGASLAGYNKLLLQPVSVTFRREWGPGESSSSPFKMSAQDAERIKGRLAASVREELLKQLGEGGYQVAESAGDDVLEARMSIVDLHATAPDLQTPGRTEAYAFSTGEMSLVAELRDSVSGDVVMRIFDRTQAFETIHPRRITVVDNEFEARKAAREWAQALRNELDLAKGAGAKR